MTAGDIHRSIDAVFRIEAPRIIAGLARLVRDVGIAEELVQDALLAALKQWPQSGLPEKPGAWLTAAAKTRAIDLFRKRKLVARKHRAMARENSEKENEMPDFDTALDDPFGDDVLRLIFTACHPVLSAEARVALTLRLVGGLSTEEIARAFLVPETTIAQRIVRAKRALAKARVPFEVPRGPDLDARLASVLEVIYLIFNEGYAATSGGDWIRPALCEDALRLGRILAARAADEAEVHGLVALMELQASRLAARVTPSGDPILLNDQDRSRWDRLLIRRGLAALGRARALRKEPQPYVLQAEIAACHARARCPEDTDWHRIAALYDELARVMPSPVVELNRAVAVAMAFGPAAGLAVADRVREETAFKDYHWLPAVRGDLLGKLGRFAEAKEAFEQAAALTRNRREKELLRKRASAMASQSS